MLARLVVGKLLGGDRQPERTPQDRFAQSERLAVEVRAERRLEHHDVGSPSVHALYGALVSCSTMAQIALICGASLPR